MKTFMQTKETNDKKWYVVDAEGKTLGRLATQIASVLRGKHKTTFTPHIDCGDFVIVINAEKVLLTGDKLDKKIYYDHSRFPGGLRERTARTMVENYPSEMIERAIKRMLPNGPLGRQMYRKLFVYSGSDHQHSAQKPEIMEIK